MAKTPHKPVRTSWANGTLLAVGAMWLACFIVLSALSSPLSSAAEDLVAEDLVGGVHAELDVVDLVSRAIDQTRGLSSVGEMSMLIQRPNWQRRSSLQAWTRGREDALIRFTAPARDAGNALLKQGDRMWTFNPKLNRSIRLPNSMMSQSWAGSDFSYNDLSRSDKWLRHYTLTLVAQGEHEGLAAYTIDATPHDDAPVVWGKEQMVIREDFVLLSQTFYDQEMVAVKELTTLKIAELGGRVMATVMRMVNLEMPEEFTEVSYDAMSFDVTLEDRLFTVFSMQSGSR